MGILNSIALGKSRKSAGNVTFYSRIGVSCFRQKPVRSPGYKSSVPQRMQQSVFRFMKANVDASGVKSFVDTFYDAKPRKNKSETKNNMFYRSFMPHLVANKQTIYELPIDDMIDPALFLGTPETNQDKLTNGQLGVLTLNSASLTAMTIDEVSLNQIIDKANTLISVNDTPYTINNLFVGIFGAAPSAPQGYKVVQPTNVVPTLADGLYSFNLTALTEGISAATTIYVALMVAGVDSSGGIDLMRRKFATDSAVLGEAVTPVPPLTISAAAKVTDQTWSITVPTKALEAIKADQANWGNKFVQLDGGDSSLGTSPTFVESGSNTVITFKQPGQSPAAIASVAVSASPVLVILAEDFEGNVIYQEKCTNGVTITH